MAGLDPTIEFSEDLANGADPFAAFQSFIEARGGKGFLFGFMGERSLKYSANDGVFFRTTYVDEWLRNFRAGSELNNDYSTDQLLQGGDYVNWQFDTSSEVDQHLTHAQKMQFELEADIGMTSGCSLALCRDRGLLSGLGYWHEDMPSAEAFDAEWKRIGPEIRRAAHLLDEHCRYVAPNAMVSLTPREIDCLSWLVIGLRPAEICDRMKVSEKTFEKHIANVKRKLHAPTRDNAVAKAVIMGLVSL